jgi:hypothetical protein
VRSRPTHPSRLTTQVVDNMMVHADDSESDSNLKPFRRSAAVSVCTQARAFIDAIVVCHPSITKRHFQTQGTLELTDEFPRRLEHLWAEGRNPDNVNHAHSRER